MTEETVSKRPAKVAPDKPPTSFRQFAIPSERVQAVSLEFMRGWLHRHQGDLDVMAEENADWRDDLAMIAVNRHGRNVLLSLRAWEATKARMTIPAAVFSPKGTNERGNGGGWFLYAADALLALPGVRAQFYVEAAVLYMQRDCAWRFNTLSEVADRAKFREGAEERIATALAKPERSFFRHEYMMESAMRVDAVTEHPALTPREIAYQDDGEEFV